MGLLKTLGGIAKFAAPIASFIPGVGPIASAGLNAASGMMSGGGAGGAPGQAAKGKGGILGGLIRGAGNLLGGLDGQQGVQGGDIARLAGIAGTGAAAYGAYRGMKSAGKDADRARGLVDGAVQRSNAAADRSQAEFELSGPMREAYRQAALGFRDRTNPFA